MSAVHTTRLQSSTGKLLASLVLTFSLLMLLAVPLIAQRSEERVELIMGELPPAGSEEYNALKRHAGDATGQVLPLTKCEVWRVRRSRLPALMRAAKARNVSVKVLDRSWNEVFVPMADAMTAMDGKQKQMVDMAMKSPSTASVGMMATPAASMIEYALTKDMDKPSIADHPMTIRIALNDKLTVTAVRRSVLIAGNRCTWHGVVEGTGQPVTIMWWNTGRITGTIQHGNRLFQLKYMGNDMIGVVETMLDKIPEEHAVMSPAQMLEMGRRASGSMTPIPAISPTPAAPTETQPAPSAPRSRPSRSDLRDQEDAPEPRKSDATRDSTSTTAKVMPSKLGADKLIKGETAKKGSQAALPKHIIDVMVAYTPRAAAHYSNIVPDLIELAIEDTNRSFRESNIDNVEVRLVHSHATDYDEAGGQHFDHLWRMVDRGNGFMEEIPPLRDQKKADVVILIVDELQGCGLATRVAADAEEAYAVVHHECAATSYSLAHEIGHIIGTRHNRPIDTSTGPFPYGHGYVSPDLHWRSMMSYRATCNGCPRLPVWSSPIVKVKGAPAGQEEADNARVIREQAGRVAAFR